LCPGGSLRRRGTFLWRRRVLFGLGLRREKQRTSKEQGQRHNVFSRAPECLDGIHDVSSEPVRILVMPSNAGTAALRKFDRVRSGTAHFLRLDSF
jgi:hypothetical protein